MDFLLSRVEEIVRVPKINWNSKHKRLFNSIVESFSFALDDLDPIGMTLGLVLEDDRISDSQLKKAIENLKADPTFAEMDDSDLKALVLYLAKLHALSAVFAPDVLATFVHFCQKVGLPCTLSAAEKGGLSTDRYDTKTILNLLVGSKVLTVKEKTAYQIQDYVIHSRDDDQSFQDKPEQVVEYYAYDPQFRRQFDYLMKKLKMKSKAEPETESKGLNKLSKFEERFKLHEEQHEEDDTEESSAFEMINDDMISKFVDGLLIVLGELEQTGEIPRIKSPQQARKFVIAVVRRMYQKRGLISKLTNKYVRFGSARELKKAKRDINKSLA